LGEHLIKIIKILSRPDAKRKLLIAFIFVFAYVLSISQLTQDIKSITAWGSFLALTLMAVSAWPLVKGFMWPSGLEHVAATELSLACHSWKNAYFRIDPDLTSRLKNVEGDNIWDKILSASNHKCTKENIARFHPLFVDEAMNTQKRIDSVIIRYSDVLPDELRVLARQAMEKLRLAPVGYAYVMQEASDQGFFNQFRQLINALSKLERPAHDLQNRTKPN
jgi:hypothetical protein